MALPETAPPLFVAQHPALDFINSAYGLGDARRETLTDDASVLAWLRAAGLLEDPAPMPPRGLVRRALALRAAADRLVRKPDSRSADDLDLVNAIRERGRPIESLEFDPGQQRPVLRQRRRDDGIDALLEPVATALAKLLAEGDMERVRECEAHDCCLLFEDTTRSGRRRWCSMAMCGNRMKVAAFRSRKQAPHTDD